MKNISVPCIPDPDCSIDVASLSQYMDTFESNAIDNQPWPQYQTSNSASFTIAHNKQNLLLKYSVMETQLSALVRDVNDEVHKDNCVEFFVAFDDQEKYYNLEFNCLGSVKIGYGKQKTNRTMLSENVIKKISIDISLNYKTNNGVDKLEWSIFLSIPKTLFLFSDIQTFEGQKARANFHKCGDGLKQKHFLTWNKIEAPEPDFHQPDFFGGITFANQLGRNI